MRKLLQLSIMCLCLAACGKYAPPVPPEALSPSSVNSLECTSTIGSVDFKWDASENDQRGKELRSMDSYQVYRKELEKPADLINEDVPFVLIATINDEHITTLLKLREEALKEGKPSHRVKVDDSLTKFTYSDKEVVPGKLYAYRIVPVNQGGVEGAYNKVVKVLYRGDSSEIQLIDEIQIEEEADE